MTELVRALESAAQKNGLFTYAFLRALRTKSADRAAAFRAIAETNAKFLKQDSSAARFVYGRLMKHSFRAGHRMDALVAALHVGLRALV